MLRYVLWAAALILITATSPGVSAHTDTPYSHIEVVYGRPLLTTLSDQLSDLGLVVYPEDRVRVFPDPSFGIGSKIEIERAPWVVVDDGGAKATYRTWTKSIKDLFQEKNIEIGDLDSVSPSPDTPLLPGGTIVVTRVVETDIHETLSISYDTTTQEDSTLALGQTQVVESGEKGIREKVYHVRRENGREVSRKLLSDRVVKNPVKRVIKTGIQTGQATWYSYFDGMKAAHRTLPFGTKVKVTNLSNGKSATVSIVDRGPWLPGRIIDLTDDAFALLAPLGSGVINVKIAVVK